MRRLRHALGRWLLRDAGLVLPAPVNLTYTQGRLYESALTMVPTMKASFDRTYASEVKRELRRLRRSRELA